MIQGLPTYKAPGEVLAEAPMAYRDILDKILAGQQHQQQIEQEGQKIGIEKQKLQPQIDLLKAQAKYYNEGGSRSGGGVALKNQMALMQQAIKDHPGMTLEQANVVTSAWLNGDATLPDGSPVPPPSGNAKLLIDINQKSRTTAGALNTMLNAQGAEQEVEVLSNLSNEWLKPYGTTYFNMSPSQIVDSFKNDDKSQDRLGKFIAAQALQYDIAPARSRLAGASPGVTLTNELVNVGMQNINARYPRLSQKAREAANKYINQALKSGFNARKSAGISASSAFNKPANQSQNQQTVKLRNKKTGQIEEVSIDEARSRGINV